MAAVTLGVLHERLPNERRVALVPESVGDALELGLAVLVETGAGAAAGFPDRAYAAYGARIVRPGELPLLADVLVGVRRPTTDAVDRLRWGQLLIGLLRPAQVPYLIRRWADDGATLISLDLVPASFGPASPLDAAAGQASIAGYKAVLIAADRLGRELGGRFTDPAQVLVLGAGAAGLRAIDTARRLGAAVQAADTGRAAQAAIARLGAGLLPLGQWDTARLAAVLPRFDIVISSVESPGRTPPPLISTAAARSMRPGSVIVDLSCGPSGGTVEPARQGSERVLGPGILVIGADELAAQVPATASAAYSRSVVALLAHLVQDGLLTVEPTDPALSGLVVSHAGSIREPGVLRLILDATAAAGLP